jgi:predicted N-acetyltransferase YhbS
MSRTDSRIVVEPECSGDEAAIAALTAEAFRNHPYSHGQEPAVIEALRDANALSVSLVARRAGEIVGHVAASPMKLGAVAAGWYGLGPLSVLPARQRRGIGSLLMRAVLEELRRRGARGCVLVGPPEYYIRFGFRADPGVTVAHVPPEYCLILRLAPNSDTGEALFHAAFSL